MVSFVWLLPLNAGWFSCSSLMRDFLFVYYLLFRFAVFCPSSVVTPRNEESRFAQTNGVISDQSIVVTPRNEESRFAQSHGLIGASNDEIASPKDMV